MNTKLLTIAAASTALAATTAGVAYGATTQDAKRPATKAGHRVGAAASSSARARAADAERPERVRCVLPADGAAPVKVAGTAVAGVATPATPPPGAPSVSVRKGDQGELVVTTPDGTVTTLPAPPEGKPDKVLVHRDEDGSFTVVVPGDGDEKAPAPPEGTGETVTSTAATPAIPCLEPPQ